MNETRQLADFAVNTRYQDLPKDVVEATKIYILDDIASGMVGSGMPWCRMVAELAHEAMAKDECTTFLQEWRTTPALAALVNGTMIGGFETDHGSAVASSHPSAAVFPAVLAIGERQHIDGKLFMAAVALGYEAVLRIGEAATRAVEDVRGFHGPGTNGPFGAAVGAGKAMGLDHSQMVNALGIAGSHAAGIREFAFEGAMTKRLHLGRSAQHGVESALLAHKGFTGPSTVLEGNHGFFKVFSPSPRPEILLADIGKVYVMKKLIVKPYACYGMHQSIIEGLCKFKAEHPMETKTIKRITVVGSEHMMMKGHDDPEPTTIMGAQYSLPFSAAIALVRDISNPLVFNEQTLWDGEVREMAKRVETVVDNKRFGQFAGDARAEITLELGSSRHTMLVEDWKGAPSNPYTVREMGDKFRHWVTQFIGKERTEKVIEKANHLEEVADVSSIARLLGG